MFASILEAQGEFSVDPQTGYNEDVKTKVHKEAKSPFESDH
jgi:hypothetical protein